MSSSKSSTRNSTMDIFKAIACIGVVFIHICFPGNVGIAMRAMGRFGVPMFFCVSGYWLSSNEFLDIANIGRKLKHIVHLIVGAELGHIVFAVIFYDLFDQVKRTAFLEKYFTTGWVERLFITNAPPVYAHLWFLYALAVLYLLVLVFINRRRQLRILGIVTPFLLLGIIFLQEFSFLKIIRGSIPVPGASMTIYWAHTVLFRALPFFLMGILFKEFSMQLKKIPVKLTILVSLTIMCEISAIVESFCFNNAQFYVGNILATIFIMIICCKYPDLHCKPLEYLGGRLFTWVYICHVAVYKILGYIAGLLHISKLSVVKWMMPIVGLVVSILIAIIIDNGIRYINRLLVKKNTNDRYK